MKHINYSKQHVPLLAIALGLAMLLTTSCNPIYRLDYLYVQGDLSGFAGKALVEEITDSRSIIQFVGIGGETGLAIQDYMSALEDDMEDALDSIQVQQVGEGLIVYMKSALIFEGSSFALNLENRSILSTLAQLLNKYELTEIIIQSHTDLPGSDEYNIKVSGQRAEAMATYFSRQSILPSRMIIMGLGNTQPNQNPKGVVENDRIEIAILPTRLLRRRAKKGKL